ncbi:MAG TPA: hypothetical protein VHC43_04685 [Mycobacteriales bacterium]|nr:hypothetical protein [Mycobacteriales bacterium]
MPDDLEGQGGPEGALVENEDPKSGLDAGAQLSAEREKTRRTVTLILLGILGGVALMGGIAMFTSDLAPKDYLSSVFTPLLAATGTALGFYFADRKS